MHGSSPERGKAWQRAAWRQGRPAVVLERSSAVRFDRLRAERDRSSGAGSRFDVGLRDYDSSRDRPCGNAGSHGSSAVCDSPGIAVAELPPPGRLR